MAGPHDPPCNASPECHEAERRSSVRYVPQVIRDISRTGMGLVLKQVHEPGTPLAIELHSPNKNIKYTVFTRVVHATAQPDGTWLVGCAFARELSNDELRNLLTSAAVLSEPAPL